MEDNRVEIEEEEVETFCGNDAEEGNNEGDNKADSEGDKTDSNKLSLAEYNKLMRSMHRHWHTTASPAAKDAGLAEDVSDSVEVPEVLRG